MCDERERLIEYIYGEAAAADRQRLEAHLGDCHDCRAEVSGLRRLRDDLLAWDVPRHEPIWRPFAPAQPVPLWRRMPAWGLAAAASVIFAAGAAGGVATRMWLPAGGDGPAATQMAASSPAMAAQPVSTITAEDLARLEASILERVRGEMETRLESVGAGAVPSPRVVFAGGDIDSLSDRLEAIEQWKDDQINLNAVFNGQFGRLNSRTSTLHDMVELSRMQRVGFETGGR